MGNRPLHGVTGILGHCVFIAELPQQSSPGGQVTTRKLGVIVENHGHLLPSDTLVGTKPPIACAGHDAVLRSPFHIGRVPSASFHIAETAGRILARVNLGLVPQHPDEHPTGHRTARAERISRGSAKQALTHSVIYRRVIPCPGFYI